jgi:hypothetical protein
MDFRYHGYGFCARLEIPQGTRYVIIFSKSFGAGLLFSLKLIILEYLRWVSPTAYIKLSALSGMAIGVGSGVPDSEKAIFLY